MTSLVNNFRLYVLQKVVEHFYFSGLGKEQQQQQQQQNVTSARRNIIKKIGEHGAFIKLSKRATGLEDKKLLEVPNLIKPWYRKSLLLPAMGIEPMTSFLVHDPEWMGCILPDDP